MIPLDDAQAEVLASCHPKDPVTVDVAEALGRVLVEPVVSPEPVPPFPNTAMDGYAVRAADVADAPARLKIIGTLAAGHAADTTIGPGQALRIMTGAPFPPGADAIAIVETTRVEDGEVVVLAPAKAGEHVRAAGEDIQAGQEVFPAGELLTPGHLGVLCSVGCKRVSVVPAPVVGVLSTGDELIDGGGALQPGQIRDSNRLTLISLLKRDGFVPVDLGIARDVEQEIEDALKGGVARCDAVMTSGGVSMGDFDYVKAVLDRIGQMHWMQVAIRPAKPFAFGLVAGRPVFGLPGNPVSSMVSYEVLARPGLRRMAGFAEVFRIPITGVVDDEGWRGARDGRTSFVRVRARFGDDGRLMVTSTGGQGSHQLHAMALANALAVTPPDVTVTQGDALPVLLLSA
jgi:molybdenum cofactor synthesis domain-containing protein